MDALKRPFHVPLAARQQQVTFTTPVIFVFAYLAEGHEADDRAYAVKALTTATSK
jgi:hypothetical protein